MSKNILMGFAEALAGPEAFFSLVRAGHNVSLFHRAQVHRPLLHLAAKCHAVPAPEEDLVQATRAIQAILEAHDYDAIYAIDDTSLWLVTQIDLGHVVPVHAVGYAAKVALDKRMQFAAAKEAGLAVPQYVTTSPQLGSIELPAIIKPALAIAQIDGRLEKGNTLYITEQETLLALGHKPLGAVPSIIQEMVHGIGEGVFGFSSAQGIVAWSGHRRLRMLNPHGSGSSACVSTVPPPELRVMVERMLQELEWRGPFMMEFLRDDRDGKMWFMELNGRLWGSLALARRLGMDHPAWAVNLAFDDSFTPKAPDPTPNVQMRHLGRELLHPLYVARGPKTNFHRKNWPHLWSTLRGSWAFGPVEGFYNYDPAHPWFFLRDALFDLKMKIRR